MSNRTLMELNHDYCPPNDDKALLVWAKQMRLYMSSGMRDCLPDGVTFKHMRHHSDPAPVIGDQSDASARLRAIEEVASEYHEAIARFFSRRREPLAGIAEYDQITAQKHRTYAREIRERVWEKEFAIDANERRVKRSCDL